MPLPDRVKSAIARCVDQKSFLQNLLYETLNWPVDRADSLEELAYSWSAAELRATGLEKTVVDARAWQLRRLEANQPWGIFFLEFKNKDAFLTGRGMAGALRKVLRGLVSSRRKDPSQKTWQREHLLFLCTYDWTHYKFAHFRPKFGDSRGSRLTMFGWGPEDSSNRTVCEFNLPALLWPDDSTKAEKWVTEWAKAFDKDRLTNDFFKRFDESLERIQSDLQEFQKYSSAEAYTQAQLLLERLIFLYFLQNRGWLSQERKYLLREFEKHRTKPEAFTYYKDFLEQVFWTLSTAPGSSGGRFSGLPFLNGGLFDDDEFFQPSDSRKANPPLKVQNRTFEFVFQELLEAFNFTVTEDTPLNQEVAVDPEMLGKVFESIVLHAEQADPDAIAPDKRKATGSYYTPRIVVHFICQEVLYQYLQNHLPFKGERQHWEPRLRALLSTDATDGFDEEERELLKKTIDPERAQKLLQTVTPLKCCDPAVGSGAFPVGLLHELLNLRRVLQAAANGGVDPVRKEGTQWLQNTKEDIVQNCLFGVDIQQQAIEICRLRLWLSLVVDYDLGIDPFEADKSQFNRAIDSISHLPNLEMNFHRGDSLHDRICDVPLLFLPERSHKLAPAFREIVKLGSDLHRAGRASRKKDLRIQILAKRIDVAKDYVEEEIRFLERDDSALDSFFGASESKAKKQIQVKAEIRKLKQALDKLESDRHDLEKLKRRQADTSWVVDLRRLEGADFNSPFNFAWYIDFPGIFTEEKERRAGFDIVVGNPPFVTARNPEKRELWRKRWPRVCHGTYHLLCPFLELGFELLRDGGELGFIVSNAFAKREFGKPVVENFIPSVDMQKIVDCSGLLFPGHGTPTCIVFGAGRSPDPGGMVRFVGILPGGGDLRTTPEESLLWHDISQHHDDPDFENSRIAVKDRRRNDIAKWPLSFDSSSEETQKLLETNGSLPLGSVVEGIGYSVLTKSDDIFFIPAHTARILGIERSILQAVTVGDELRNWAFTESLIALFPYDSSMKPVVLDKYERLKGYLKPFRSTLDSVITFGKTKSEAGRQWYEYFSPYEERHSFSATISYPDISTHNHFVLFETHRLFKDTAPLVLLRHPNDAIPLCGLLNSSVALFWLKQVSFNKGAGSDEERDRFEFATGKMQELPVAAIIANGLREDRASAVNALAGLATSCSKKGHLISSLALRRLFEKQGEDYQAWNASLPSYTTPKSQFDRDFKDEVGFRELYRHLCETRDVLRAEMIALQEEMDWLLYSMYRLLPEPYPAAQTEREPAPLNREQRPFCLWAEAGGDYESAVRLIPPNWPASRKALWQARLSAMRDNEHIRHIEQPVFKRRWDEQWKVGNQWRCGAVAYAAELVDGFEWWLREKAEWLLENQKTGGPVEFSEWVADVWKDSRVRAAWAVAAEEYTRLDYEKASERAVQNGDSVPMPTPPAADQASFVQKFREIVDEETVPEGFPFAIPYDELEKKLRKTIPAKLHRVRGKLNVPRERFYLRGKTQYLWAGLQFK